MSGLTGSLKEKKVGYVELIYDLNGAEYRGLRCLRFFHVPADILLRKKNKGFRTER